MLGVLEVKDPLGSSTFKASDHWFGLVFTFTSGCAKGW